MQPSQALIQDPTALAVFFAGFVAVVFLAARTPPLDRIFRFTEKEPISPLGLGVITKNIELRVLAQLKP